MSVSPHLGLTLLESGQAQKEVTVNEAFARIDLLLNSGVESRSLNSPPTEPEEGAVYIVGGSPTGDWADQAAHFAWFDQLWRFLEPQEGVRAFVKEEGRFLAYSSGGWVSEDMLHRRIHGIGASGSSCVVNPYQGEIQQLTLDAPSLALSLGSCPSGRVVEILLTLQQDATGGRLVSWDSAIHWPAGTAPVLSTAAGGLDFFSFVSWDGGINWFGRVLALGYFT